MIKLSNLSTNCFPDESPLKLRTTLPEKYEGLVGEYLTATP